MHERRYPIFSFGSSTDAITNNLLRRPRLELQRARGDLDEAEPGERVGVEAVCLDLRLVDLALHADVALTLAIR